MNNLSVRGPVQQPPPGNTDAQESWPRWQQPIGASAPSNAPPMACYELYREKKEAYHQGAPKIVSGKAGGVGSGCLPSSRSSYAETSTGLTPLSNPYPPEDWKAIHGCGPPLYYSPMRTSVSTSVATSIGPPLYLPNGRWDQSSTLQNQIAGAICPTPGLGFFGRDSDDEAHMPWLSVTLTISYTIIFIMTMQHNNCPENTVNKNLCLLPSLGKFSFQPWSENPLLGSSGRTLMGMGALEAELVTKAHEGWRLLTSMWLHAGVFHIIGNLMGLLIFGIPLERQIGYLKVAFIFILSGFGGSVLSALFLHGRVSTGASAAFMGLVGASLSSVVTHWDSHPHRTQSLVAIAFFVILNLVYGFMPLVDNFLNAGGVFIGFFLANLFFLQQNLGWYSPAWLKAHAAIHDTDDIPVKPLKNKILLNIAWLLSLALLIAGITMALIALFTGMDVNKEGTWSQYLTCVPTHLWKCYGDRRNLGCNPSSIHGALHIACANNQTGDWPSISYSNQLTSQIQKLCIKTCV